MAGGQVLFPQARRADSEEIDPLPQTKVTRPFSRTRAAERGAASKARIRRIRVTEGAASQVPRAPFRLHLIQTVRRGNGPQRLGRAIVETRQARAGCRGQLLKTEDAIEKVPELAGHRRESGGESSPNILKAQLRGAYLPFLPPRRPRPFGSPFGSPVLTSPCSGDPRSCSSPP